MSVRTLHAAMGRKVRIRSLCSTRQEAIATVSFLSAITDLFHQGIITGPPSPPAVYEVPDWFEGIWRRCVESHMQRSEMFEACLAAIVSVYHRFPFTTNDPVLGQSPKAGTPVEHLSGVLATTAISQLALPEFRPAHVDDLLEARTALRDELFEFRAGILNLTHLLYQQVKDANDLTEVRQEADTLVNTRIKAAVMSLENRMRKHENKRIRRMLLGTGRVLVEAAKMFLPGGWQERFVAGGKALLQTATEVDSAKPPEDQIATYLYKLKRQFKS